MAATAKTCNAENISETHSAVPIRLISKAEVCDRVGRTFPCIWAMMRAGKFPRARELGGKPAWIESEIEAWIASLPVREYKGDRSRTNATA
jgi:predicted DNA-binding transcriptional regulator AlpA